MIYEESLHTWRVNITACGTKLWCRYTYCVILAAKRGSIFGSVDPKLPDGPPRARGRRNSRSSLALSLRELRALFAAPFTFLRRHQLSRLHVELPRRLNLPLVKARAAQCFALSALLLELAEVRDVGHAGTVIK
jgi:hypothetical protein